VRAPGRARAQGTVLADSERAPRKSPANLGTLSKQGQGLGSRIMRISAHSKQTGNMY